MSAAEARSAGVSRRYLRAPEPLVFPCEEEMPEVGVHLRLRTLLWQLIREEFGDRAIVGSDQFVFWDATDPKRRLAPDVMVWVGAPDTPIRSWKVWERGAPHLAIEIVSDDDRSRRVWDEKLAGYRQCGVRELVRFDPERPAAALRLWDRVEEDLVERDLTGPDALLCDALNLHWCVTPDPELGLVLRLSRSADGDGLVPTLEERVRSLEERKRDAERALADSEARVQALLAELERARRR